MPADKPTELSRIKLKTLTRQPVPMTSNHSAHLTPLPFWHLHLALAIYIFVVVNFDALAQASNCRIERRQAVFLCWMQDSNPEGLWNPISSRLSACWQTDWAIEDQAKNFNSTARPYGQQAFSPPDPTAILAFAPGSGDMHICCCSMRLRVSNGNLCVSGIVTANVVLVFEPNQTSSGGNTLSISQVSVPIPQPLFNRIYTCVGIMGVNFLPPWSGQI